MSKYEPLAAYLEQSTSDMVHFTFAEIEKVLNFKLPASAHKYDAWWGNSSSGNHSQALAWLSTGWEVSSVDRSAKRVVLKRKEHKEAQGELASNTDLWRQAAQICGIAERNRLEREVVTSYIRQAAGERLIALGGAMPDASAPSRRSFE